MARSTCSQEMSDPILAEREETEDVIEIAKYLNRPNRDRASFLVGPDGSRIKIPDSLHAVLTQAAQALANDEAVSIVPVHHELTTQQAADLLMVSRPHLIKMLENGDIPYHKIGTHRRIRFDDLMRYRTKRDRRRLEMLQELASEDAELGI